MIAHASTGNVRADFHYDAFGLRIASELPLPELASLRVAPAPAADLVVRWAALPASFRAGGAPCDPVWVCGDDVVLTVDSVARYLVRGGREIVVDAEPGASEVNLRLFLLGSALGALCHQRGLLPLHANAIEADGGAVAFVGRTGVGKSTLAAYFQLCGCAVLCDDVCVVGFDASGRPSVWPGLPRLKLWRDAAEAFGHDSRGLEPAIDGRDKYHVPVAASATRGPFPLARVYVLEDLAAEADAQVVRLSGSTAVQAIMENTYRRMYLRPMGLVGANFLQAAAIARNAHIFAAPRRRGFDVFEAEAARLQGHVMQDRGPGTREDGASSRTVRRSGVSCA